MTGRRAGGLRRLALGAAAALALGMSVGAPSAQAHAFLTGSNPADGAVLDVAPAQLVLHFSESVVLTGMRVSVVDASGQEVSVGQPRLVGAANDRVSTDASKPAAGAASSDTEAPMSIAVDLPHLDRGSYRVSWATVSSDDLHRTAGVLVFGIQTTVTAAGWVESAPGPTESALRWVILIAVAAGIGAPVARWLFRRGGADRAANRLVARSVAAGAVLGLTAAVALLADQVVASGGVLSALTDVGYAERWAVRSLGLLLLLAGAAAELRPLSRRGDAAGRRARFVSVPAAVLAATGTAVLGHAGSGATGSVGAALFATLHILATGTWMGTLGLVVLVLARLRLPREQARVVLVHFAGVAALSVTVMVASGLMLASGVVGSLDALLLTDYGRLLILKVAVVGVLMALGLITHIRLRRTARPVGRLVLVEAAGGVLVLLLTGALSSGQPALERQLLIDPSTPASTSVYQQMSDLHESLSIRPNLPGQNVAVLQVTDTRRPAPGRVTGVKLVVVDASGSTRTHVATPIGDNQWSVPVVLTDSGPGTVRTVVERQGLPVTAGEIAWTTGWPGGTPPALVSRAPLQPLLQGAAWVVLALMVAGLLIALRRAATASATTRASRARPTPAPGTRGPVDADQVPAGRREG